MKIVSKKIKSVAIVTLYDEVNIGNKLQNYALQELLKQYSESVRTLTYTESSPALGWKGRFALKTGFPRKIAEEKRAVVKRRRRFEDFSHKYLETNPPISYKCIPAEINKRFDYFIVGSDQVWHNFSDTDAELDYFLLTFVDEDKRICFAPSLGLERFPERYKERYATELSKFKYLSCREADGCNLIRALTGNEVQLLPDPTMALDIDYWIKIEKKPDYNLPDNFILVYFLPKLDESSRRLIHELSLRTNLDVVDIYNPSMMDYYITRPDEFIYLLRRASYVCTNSFHASAFSILFQRKLKVFGRKDGDGKKMGSRISTLINEFGLKENSDGFIETNENVDVILEKKKKQASEYLEKVFEIV